MKIIRIKFFSLQLEIEEEFGFDPASPEGHNKKKRRSWKGHRLEGNEGMYACDQCEKVFGKQSSLARHKYEHSGR